MELLYGLKNNYYFEHTNWFGNTTGMTTGSQLFSSKAALLKQMSVRLYVCMSGLGEARFSRPLIEISLPLFYVQIPLINEHLFCKYFVRLSVGKATKVFATYGFHPCLQF